MSTPGCYCAGCIGMGPCDHQEPDRDDYDYNLIDCPACDGDDGDCATCGGWGTVRDDEEEWEVIR